MNLQILRTTPRSFSSRTHLKAQSEGQWEASGKLTLIRIERPATADPNEAYRGPVYDDPIVNTVSRDPTLLFSLPSSGAERDPQAHWKRQFVERDFPHMPSAVRDAPWPTISENRTCQPRSTVGEDDAGQVRSGKTVTVAPLRTTYADIGEDLRGTDTVALSGDRSAVSVNMVALHPPRQGVREQPNKA